MTTIGELFPKCNKLAYDARQQLLQMQQQQAIGTRSSADLFLVLDDLDRQLNIMEEDMVLREAPAQREKWKRKIRDLRVEAQKLRQQGQAVDYQYRQHQQQQQQSYHSNRDELLRRRRRPQNEVDDLDQLAAEGESLEQSNRMVTQFIDQGSATLGDLQRQRGQMRGIRGRLMDISNSLGLTQSTMRIIERRDITDAYLVAVLMVVTIIVFYVVWIVEYGE